MIGVSNYFDREVQRQTFVMVRWDLREREKIAYEQEQKMKAGVRNINRKVVKKKKINIYIYILLKVLFSQNYESGIDPTIYCVASYFANPLNNMSKPGFMILQVNCAVTTEILKQ